jgi:hypothetical protein
MRKILPEQIFIPSKGWIKEIVAIRLFRKEFALQDPPIPTVQYCCCACGKLCTIFGIWDLPHFVRSTCFDEQPVGKPYLVPFGGSPTSPRELPTVRHAIQDRDYLGRYIRDESYFWKPDFDLYMEWMRDHYVKEAERQLCSSKLQTSIAK